MKSNAQKISFTASAALFLHLAATITMKLCISNINFSSYAYRLLFGVAAQLLCLCIAYFTFITFLHQHKCPILTVKKNSSFSFGKKLVLLFFCASAIFLFGRVYALMFPQASGIDIPEGATIFDHLLIVISYVIIPAFFEELVFRGCFAREFTAFGMTAAVILSSLIFGLTHFSFVSFPYAFICGMILGAAYLITGSFLVAVGIHFVSNYSGYVLTAIKPLLESGAYFRILGIFTVLMVIVFAVCGTFLVIHIRKTSVYESVEHAPSWEFLTASMTLYLFCALAVNILL